MRKEAFVFISLVLTMALAGNTTAIGSTLASGPSPANNAVDVSPDYTTLTWIPATAAKSHDVYIGTSSASVNDANHTTPPGIYKGNYNVNGYQICGSYQTGQKYYWRIDEVNAPNIYKGPVWSFTANTFLDYPFGDLGKDGVVSWDDLTILAAQWLNTTCSCGDINGDSSVNLMDYGMLANNWMLNSDVWVNIDPGGGGAFMAAGAGPSGIILAGGDLSGGYMSDDSGKHWSVLGFTRGVDETHISGVGFDTKDPNIFYLGAEDYLFRTANGGASFNKVSSGGYYTDVVFSPADPNIGFAGRMSSYSSTTGQIYKTTNRGLNWSKSSVDLPTGLWIRKIITHPTNTSIVYAVSSNKNSGALSAYVSSNGGVNWTKVAPALTDVWDLAIDPVNPLNIYVVASNGVNKSTDGGSSWSFLKNYSGYIFVNFKNPQVLRLINVISGVCYESLNAGSSWTTKSSISNWDKGFQPTFYYGEGGGESTINADMSDPNRYYWITYQWVYGSFDGGATFKPLYTRQKPSGSNMWRTTGINNTVLLDLAISEANPDYVYLGFYDMGIWRSTNHGESWQTGNSVSLTGEWQGKGGDTKTIVADPDRVGVVWANVGNGKTVGIIAKSTQGGTPASWVGTSISGDVWGLSLDRNSPVNNRKLFATISGAVYRSVNDGNSWTQVFSGGSARATAVDNFDSSLVFAGGDGGFWRSTSGGDSGTWTAVGISGMTGAYTIKADPVNTGWVYVACYGSGKGLYRSKDQGTTWEKLLSDSYMRGVAIDPVDPNTIYATSSQNSCCGASPSGSTGVKRSKDGGLTWKQVNEGLPWPFAWPIQVDPSNHNRVFVGSPGTGFYKRLFSN